MFRDRIIRFRVSWSALFNSTRNPTARFNDAVRWALWAATIPVACSRPEIRPLQDTEGRRFAAHMKQDEVVKVLSTETSSEDAPFVLKRKGHLVAVCPESRPASNTAMGECRGLVCREDHDCPPAHGLKNGTCINGLCIEPSQAITPDDAIMLCLAGTGVGHSSPQQVDRFALGLNCGTPCRVPAPCRQP